MGNSGSGSAEPASSQSSSSEPTPSPPPISAPTASPPTAGRANPSSSTDVQPPSRRAMIVAETRTQRSRLRRAMIVAETRRSDETPNTEGNTSVPPPASPPNLLQTVPRSSFHNLPTTTQRSRLRRAMIVAETRKQFLQSLLEQFLQSFLGQKLEKELDSRLSPMVPKSPMKLSSSLEFLPPTMSELRVVLLGNSCSERSSVGNFILGENKFNTEEEPDRCVRVSGLIKDKDIVLINTPDLLLPNISEDELREHVGTCERLSAPGPHVFLLLLQPEDFTEGHRQRLCRVLELFSDRSFDHSLVLISTPREEKPGFMEEYRQHPRIRDMIKMCKYRFLWRKDLELEELLTRFEQIVKENNGEHLNQS